MNDLSQSAVRVSVTTILVNLLLSVLKLAAGLIARSGAMISDAVHSASDVFSTLIVIAGVKLSERAADKEHPFGHERMECVAAIVLAVVLLITGLFIGYGSVQRILAAESEPLPVPGRLALLAAVVSIAVKEAMFWYTRRYAKALDSSSLMADAWHHRSDALSSVGALVGIAGARLGLPILDPVAGVVICLFVAKAAVEIFRDAVDKMIDRSCDEKTEAAFRETALSHPGVMGIDRMMTREFGSRIYVEMEIAVDSRLSVVEAHGIAEEVHDSIEAAFPKVKHIMIHVNPANE